MKTSNDPKKIALGALALGLFAIVGCATQPVDAQREQTSCEISLNAICATASENYFAGPAIRPARAMTSKSPHVVPLVAPVTLPGGELAAEVDCYVHVDADGYWLVYAHVAIAPTSQQAVEHLRDQALCVNGSPERRLALGSTYDP